MVLSNPFRDSQSHKFKDSVIFIWYLVFTICCSLKYYGDDYVNYTFQLSKEGPKQVQIEGDFTGWVKIPMEKIGKMWVKTFKLKSNKIYEYRFIVDDTVEIDPSSKNRSATNNTSILFLDSSGQPIKIDRKDINAIIIQDTIKELLNNQKKFLEELELIRNEIVKRDLQIELLKTNLDKSEVERKEKYESLQSIKSQYEQLSKRALELEQELKKLQKDADSAKKDYKNMQNNYFHCLKVSGELKKQIKSIEKKYKKKIKNIVKNFTKPGKQAKTGAVDMVEKSNNSEKEKFKPSYVKIGKIYEVSDTSNLVVIYVGENSNLSTGDMLYVLQNNEIAATLTVTSVEKDWCYAKVISGNKSGVKKQDVYIISQSK